jgi:hypothetical protein
MENRYDKATLSRFVHVASNDNCLKQCHSKLDARWLLKPMREPILRDWKSLPTTKVRLPSSTTPSKPSGTILSSFLLQEVVLSSCNKKFFLLQLDVKIAVLLVVLMTS